MPLRHPAQDEEGATHVELVEQAEQALGVGDDAAFHARPRVAVDDVVEGADLEIVFHVHRHGVDHPSLARHQAPFRRMTVLTVSKTM
jgi:hypothetical protein